MSEAKPFQPSEQQLSDEVRLIRLLEEHAKAVSEQRSESFIKSLEDDIITLMDKHFREALRPQFIKKFRGLASQKGDASVRYTHVVNDFFVVVLKQRDDSVWRAKTAKQLRSFASVVMTHDVIDHLRRKKRAPKTVDDIGAFADQRQIHFEKYNDVRFEPSLATLERWRVVGSEDERRMAFVILHHYIDGTDYGKIADDLGVSKDEVYRIRENAMKRLRKAASHDE